MTTQFALDLRLARRKAGFTQNDTAHLLGLRTAALSALEQGRRLPSLTQICTLSLIYGRSFESLFGAILRQARRDIEERLMTLPAKVRVCGATQNRTASLDRLARQLADERDGDEA
ncbi:MAG: helix-turn-helix transcriptional regulator [Rhizobiaceae bacterium]